MAAQDLERQEETAQAPSWRAEFLAGLSYEVRTPLSGAVGMTDLLLETPLSVEQRDYVLTARACLDELVSLLDKSLELAELALSPDAAIGQEFHLPETLRAALARCGQTQLGPSASIEVRIAPDLPEVAVGDALRLRELVSEMIRSAEDMCNHGRILVRIFGEHSVTQFRLVLEVKVQLQPAAHPDGPGAWSPVDGQGSKVRGWPRGLHLSWALAYELARLLNGSFWFGYEPGEGCLCRSVIPLVLPGATPDGDGIAPEGSDRKTILLVEDNEVARRVATYILERAAYQVECAKDGREAVERASALRFDLVLMDLQLPGVDGFEVARQLHSLPGYSSVPILALTANVTSEYRNLCLRQGMADFLPKPLQPRELLAAVEQALRR